MSLNQRFFSLLNYFLLTSTLLFITGCATDQPLRSELHVKGATKISNLNVYYLERNLVNANSTSSVNKALTKWGYFEIGPKLGEFGPLLFEKNGLSGTFNTVLGEQFVPSSTSKTQSTQGVLLLEFRNARVISKGFVDQNASMMLNATLFNPTKNNRIWSGQFNSHLGSDPALGIMKVTTVNQEYINTLLTMVLEQMSKDQILALPNGKISK